jgi:hypothetical protein
MQPRGQSAPHKESPAEAGLRCTGTLSTARIATLRLDHADRQSRALYPEVRRGPARPAPILACRETACALPLFVA